MLIQVKKIFYTSYNTNNKETAYSDKIFNNVFKQYSGEFQVAIKIIFIITGLFMTIHSLR